MQVTVIIPAYLNNEIGILDETLTAHAGCEYRGPMTVMLMYNKKPGSGAKFREAERELVARWNGYSVRNLRCGSLCTPRSSWSTKILQQRPSAAAALMLGAAAVSLVLHPESAVLRCPHASARSSAMERPLLPSMLRRSRLATSGPS